MNGFKCYVLLKKEDATYVYVTLLCKSLLMLQARVLRNSICRCLAETAARCKRDEGIGSNSHRRQVTKTR